MHLHNFDAIYKQKRKPNKKQNKKENKICNKNPLGGTPGIIRDF